MSIGTAQGKPQDVMTQGESCVSLNPESVHDLAGPLHQICSIAELLARKYRGHLDEEAETLLGFLQSSADRLECLLQGLNRYFEATIASGICVDCDTTELLSGSLKSLRSIIRERGAVVTHDPLPKVPCDPNRMAWVFGSLIENALKFRHGEEKPEIHVSAVAEDLDWIFSVRDNGIGIAPRYHKHIFRVFKRVHHGAYSGAGVGLSIVQRIIDDHGGRIWVESEPGQGATFFFTLPRPERSRSL